MAANEQKQGFLTRLRAKVNKPGSWLSYDLANLFRGRKIDEAILEELEARLLGADVGVEATDVLLEHLRQLAAAWAPDADNYRRNFESAEPRESLQKILRALWRQKRLSTSPSLRGLPKS